LGYVIDIAGEEGIRKSSDPYERHVHADFCQVTEINLLVFPGRLNVEVQTCKMCEMILKCRRKVGTSWLVPDTFPLANSKCT
jgi:hypothetical protein